MPSDNGILFASRHLCCMCKCLFALIKRNAVSSCNAFRASHSSGQLSSLRVASVFKKFNFKKKILLWDHVALSNTSLNWQFTFNFLLCEKWKWNWWRVRLMWETDRRFLLIISVSISDTTIWQPEMLMIFFASYFFNYVFHCTGKGFVNSLFKAFPYIGNSCLNESLWVTHSQELLTSKRITFLCRMKTKKMIVPLLPSPQCCTMPFTSYYVFYTLH